MIITGIQRRNDEKQRGWREGADAGHGSGADYKALPLSKGNGKESTAKKKRETEDTNLLRLH